MYDIITFKDNLADPITGNILSLVLTQLQNLFSGVDPGHWENGRFIPGDLEQRLNYAAQRITFYNVASVADQSIIYDILTEVPPAQYAGGGSWQGNLDSYLGTLQRGLQNGTIVPGQTSNPLLPPGSEGSGTGGGFVYNFQSFGNLLPVVGVLALGYYALKGKKKKGKKRK